MSYLTKTLREPFGKEYYQTNNYKDYLTRKFDALAADIYGQTKLMPDGTVIDFGCGFGGLLNSFYKMCVDKLHGTDISNWAIEEGKRRFPYLAGRLEYYNRNLLTLSSELILFLDVLEHMPEYEVETSLRLARIGAKGQLAVRIPVCAVEGEPFVLPVSNNDPTHICCHTKDWWQQQLEKAGFKEAGIFATNAIYDSPGVLARYYTPTKA